MFFEPGAPFLADGVQFAAAFLEVADRPFEAVGFGAHDLVVGKLGVGFPAGPGAGFFSPMVAAAPVVGDLGVVLGVSVGFGRDEPAGGVASGVLT